MAVWCLHGCFTKVALPTFFNINNNTYSNANEVAQWRAPSYSRPQSATDNGVGDRRSNWLAVTLTPPLGLPGQHTACAATQSIEVKGPYIYERVMHYLKWPLKEMLQLSG